MSDSLASILGKREFHEPPEVQAIKTFVRKKFSTDCGVKITDRLIIIEVNNASLASALRMHLYTLREACQTKKRLVIRIV